jgi:predicted acetyltransferase
VAATSLLRPMTASDRHPIERLWQLYSHDMSEIRGTLPDAEGLYKPGRLPTYFDDPDRAGYVITYDGALAGFAFVTGRSGQVRSIGDFFVVRAARRHGVGSLVALRLITDHPGAWEIGFQGHNAGAPEFWRRVVIDAVGTRWQEVRRPVPHKPHIPDDHFISFTI